MRTRRFLLTGAAKAIGFFALWPAAVLGQRAPQPMPSPHAPNPSFPPGLDGPDIRPQSGSKAADPQIQLKIKTDVQQLYAMVSDLKDQVEKSDATSTLSLGLVKKAQQIEKLAKQIKDLAKG